MSNNSADKTKQKSNGSEQAGKRVTHEQLVKFSLDATLELGRSCYIQSDAEFFRSLLRWTPQNTRSNWGSARTPGLQLRHGVKGTGYFLSTSSFRLERVGPVDASYSQVQIDLQSSSASLVLQKVFDDSLTDELKPIGSLITVRPHVPASLSRLPQGRDRPARSDSNLTKANHLSTLPSLI